MSARRLITGAAVLFVATGAALAAGALTGQRTPPQPPAASSSPTPPPAILGAAAALPSAPPTAIDIPQIGVHTTVGDVGLTASGAMEVPRQPHYDQPAWYRYSPTPGARGPAVIVGHVDSAHGPSVFFRLGALRAGALIDVHRRDGRSARFVVRDVRRFPKSQFPTSVVYGDTAGAELRLITCGGSFDHSSGHHTDNVVVFASLSPP